MKNYLVCIRDDVGETVMRPDLMPSLADFERSIKALPEDNFLKQYADDYSYCFVACFDDGEFDNPVSILYTVPQWKKISTITGGKKNE